MTETFTKSEFETLALPVHKETGVRLWDHIGLKSGEHAYSISVDDQVKIEVRSSVDDSGICAANGEDSIRAWLTTSDGRPLGSKVSKWTTRRKGWETRTKDVLRTLWGWRKAAGNCECCGEPRQIFKVKKEGQNKGRVFANCRECEGQFRWLTTANAPKPSNKSLAQKPSNKSLDAEAEVMYIESQQR